MYSAIKQRKYLNISLAILGESKALFTFRDKSSLSVADDPVERFRSFVVIPVLSPSISMSESIGKISLPFTGEPS